METDYGMNYGKEIPQEEVSPLPQELKEILAPHRTAVIVIDAQGSYCNPNEPLVRDLMGSDTDDLQKMLPRLHSFIDEARSKGVKIVWTQMIEDPRDTQPNLRRKMELTDTPPLSVAGTPAFELLIPPQEGDHIVVKRTYNAFTGTDLDTYLKHQGISSLVITGAYASRCVDATAIVAADALGYDVFVPKDLVGVPRRISDEPTQTLKRFDTIFGWVVPSQAITEAWKPALEHL